MSAGPGKGDQLVSFGARRVAETLDSATVAATFATAAYRSKADTASSAKGKNISVSSCLAPLSGEEVEETRLLSGTVLGMVQASSRESRVEPDEKALNQAAEEPKNGYSKLFLEARCRSMRVKPGSQKYGRFRRVKGNVDMKRGFAIKKEVGPSIQKLAVTLLIFVNALVIGLQFQQPGYSASADELWPGISTVFDVLQVTFTSLFLVDVVIRGCLFWKTFFCDWFNWLDLVVVLSSVFDLITSGMFNTSVLRLLRLTKLTRSIRILKVSSVLDSLNMIMLPGCRKCLRASVGTLFWSLCVLLVIQCIGAIVIMYTVQTYIRSPNDLTQENRLLVFAYFGTFSRSMLTMFEVLFANWITPCRILVEHLSEYFSAVFILYRCLVGFAVLNVIQAVFIQRTMQVAQDDKELQLKQKQYAAKTFERKLRYIFEELDTSGDGIVTWEEFDDQLKDPRTGALLSMIELRLWLKNTGDRQWLMAMSLPTNSEIHADSMNHDVEDRSIFTDFLHGLSKFRSLLAEAKGIDLAQLSKNVGRLGLMERLQGADVGDYPRLGCDDYCYYAFAIVSIVIFVLVIAMFPSVVMVPMRGERRSRWPLAVYLAGEKASTDVVTCNVLLNAALRISWQRALATVTQMEAEGIQPDSVTYNTAAHALCKDQDQWQMTLQLLHDSAKAGIRPGKVSFAALAAVARRRRQWRQAVHLLQRMEEEQVEADAVSCALALRCLEDCSEWSWAMLLLQRPGLDSTCLNVALSAVLAGPEAAWHRGLCLVTHALRHGPAPDSVSCSTVASACARAAVPGVAHRLLRSLQFSGVRLGTSAYNAFMASSRGHWSLAMATFQEMGEKALPRDAITVGAAVAALAADSAAWAKAMYFPRHRLNTPATTACSTACCNAREWVEALAVHSKLAHSGLQEACAETARWPLALALRGWGPGARITLDAISANAAVTACRSAWQRALLLLSEQAQLDAASSELAAVAAEASEQGAAVAMLLEDLEGRVEEVLRR
ncbi:MEE40 [Symbiodinium sp. CCMP2592]|nr:MEE40 [Symbiodinium sp. CCMP2592]